MSGWPQGLASELREWTLGRRGRLVMSAAAAISLLVSGLLAINYDVLGGAGDELEYHEQADDLIPFEHNFYGPGYFVALRVARMLPGVDWFAAGKIISWVSAIAFLYLSYLLVARVAPALSRTWIMVLLAFNPLFIGQSYFTLTIMFGGALGMLGIVLATRLDEGALRSWIAVGVVLGIASLTRFQNSSLFLGVLLGLLVQPQAAARRRIERAGSLALGYGALHLSWVVFLLAVQGFVPANHNFVHLTTSLGQFESFRQVGAIVDRYGSTWGLVSADPSVLLSIVSFGAAELVKFPFRVGLDILFLGAGFLLPGAAILALTRRLHQPWLFGFAVGLFLTGVGSRRWDHYYLLFLPFCLILVAYGVEILKGWKREAVWALLVVTLVPWSAFTIRNDFRSVRWVELGQARQYLNALDEGPMFITSTAGSLPYDSEFEFVDLDSGTRFDLQSEEELLRQLRQEGITHLVITERHGVQEYPLLGSLLDRPATELSEGLNVVFSIEDPRRLRILAVN